MSNNVPDDWYGHKHLILAWDQIKYDFSYPLFSVLFICLVIFFIWTSIQKNLKLKRAGHVALITFLIAYLSRLNLVFTAVIIVTTISFFGIIETGRVD